MGIFMGYVSLPEGTLPQGYDKNLKMMRTQNGISFSGAIFRC